MLSITQVVTQRVRAIARQAMRFVFPTNCATCDIPLTNDPIPYFCTSCWNAITPLPPPRCSRCNYPFPSPAATSHTPHQVCWSCRKRPPSFTKAWTLYPYVTPLREALHLFKYRGKVVLAGPLARLIIDQFPAWNSFDLVIPVPLHDHRLREREFNQSLLLADQIGHHFGLRVSCTDLVRIRSSPQQTTLRRKERLKNLRGVFAVPHPSSVRGKRILLIDDVLTTGTTVNECAKALRRAGSSDVYVLTLARTIDNGQIPDRLLNQSHHRAHN